MHMTLVNLYLVMILGTKYRLPGGGTPLKELTNRLRRFLAR